MRSAFGEVDFDPGLSTVCSDCDLSTELFDNDSEILNGRCCLLLSSCFWLFMTCRCVAVRTFYAWSTWRMCNVHINLSSIRTKPNENGTQPLAGWNITVFLWHPCLNIDCRWSKSNSITRIELRIPEALSFVCQVNGFSLPKIVVAWHPGTFGIRYWDLLHKRHPYP